jgi:hypothetical protein
VIFIGNQDILKNIKTNQSKPEISARPTTIATTPIEISTNLDINLKNANCNKNLILKEF